MQLSLDILFQEAECLGIPRGGSMTVRSCCVLLALAFALEARPAEAQCTYSVSPLNVSAPSTGSNGSISVITGSSCAWTAVSNASWITITSPASNTGLGSANYTVAANSSGGPRSGTLTIAGQTVTVSQAFGSCGYTVSPTSATVPSTGSNGSVSVITGSSCPWTATSNASWITITSGASGTGIASVNYSVAVNSGSGSRSGTLTVAGQTVTINQGAGCSYSVSPTSVSVPSTGSNGSVSVVTGSSCAWTAVSNDSWITITSGASMSGLGSTNYSVAVNPTSSSRIGTLTVAGQTVTITQGAGCSYSISPTSVSVPSTGSNGSVSVVTGSSCAWTAVSNDSWITITSGASMSGLGSTNYSVAVNPTTSSRTGTLTVAGQTVTITQGAGCNYSVSPTSVSVPSTGSNGSVSVVTGSSCAWTAVSNDSWITITSGASMSGLGSTNYSVAVNSTGSPRTGTLTVAGQTVTITQGATCTYSISPTSVSVPSTGSNQSVAVTTGSGCAWTAVSNDSWITITSGASMSGLGSTNYSVAVNSTGSPRTGTLTVAGQTVTITQGATCTYSISPTSVSVPSTGSNQSVAVTTGSGCAWTAVSNDSWITITSGASMSGLGSTNYSVAVNSTGSPRTGTLTVAGQTVTITQGATCTYSVSPTSASVPSTGSNQSVSVTTGSSCAWTSVSNASWITITSGASMSGLGSTNYSVAVNSTASPRTGTLTVAGQTVTVSQAAGSCSYSVSPTSVSVPSTGSNQSVSVTTGSSCAWTSVSNASWITITSGASMSGLGSTNYSVAANPTSSTRTGTLTVAGQTVTVTQAGGSCTYSVSPTSVSVASTASNGSVAVTTGSGCAWTATSAVSWITITSGASMSGLGSASYSVAANTATTSRSGTLTIAGRTVTVTQVGNGQPPPQAPAAPRGLRFVGGS